MKISSDSPPPSVQLACFQCDGATENDHYVVCFYLPKIKSFANSYDSSGNTDVHIFYINGTKKYLNINDNKIYNTATVTDGVWSFDDEDTSIKGQSDKPATQALNPTDPDAFVFTGTEADYQSAYVAKYMTLPETIGYYGDSEVTYSFTLEDDAGLAAGMTTSNKATRLTPPILLNAEDGAEIESGTDATHCRSYAADEESMYFTLRIVHNGKDAEDRPCGSVKINYTITEITGADVFGGNDTLIGTANGSATLKLPKGKYDIQATASKDYYITSLKKEAEYVQVTKPAVYYISQTGDDHDPGSKALPYKTVQCAVNAFDDGIRYGEYPSDGICTIYVMTDLEAESETSFKADESNPNSKSLVAIGGTSYAATVNIIGYGGTRTIDARGSDFDDGTTIHRVMRVDGGHLVLENINLAGGYTTKNDNTNGIGMGLLAQNSGTTVKYTGGSVYNNDNYNSKGAGIYINDAKVELQDVTIRDNGKRQPCLNGNGIYVSGTSDVTMTNCSVLDNGSSELFDGIWSFTGGGVECNAYGGKLYIKGGLIKGNKTRVRGEGGVPHSGSASHGGGIYLQCGELTLEGVTITGNESYSGGAGLYQKFVSSGSLKIKGGAGGVKTTIYDNYATGTTTQSNVYLPTNSDATPTSHKLITIDGNIGASKIGVSVPFTDSYKPVAGASKDFTSGYNYLTTNAKKPGEVFVAENGYGIALNGVEASFAVSSASSYNATDYTFTPTLRTDCAPSVYPGATKTFVINDLIGKRKVAGSSPVSYDSMYLDRSNLTLYKMNESTPVYDPTGKTVSISAALYSGGTKVRDATRDASDARKFTLVAKTAGNAKDLPPNNYTLKVFVEFLGATHEANIPIAIDYSAETVADYINKGLTTSGLYSVKVTGTVGPEYSGDYTQTLADDSDGGLAKVAKAIRSKTGTGVTIDLDATGTIYVPADGNPSDPDYNPLGGYVYSYFKNCAALHSFKMPDWMLGVLPSLFENCSGLDSVEIPDSVVSVGASAFSECRNLDSITFAGTSTEWKKVEFGTNWRYNVKTNKVHCAGDNKDVPFGFFEVSYIRGGAPGAASKYCTSAISGSGTETDPFIVEGGIGTIYIDVDTDNLRDLGVSPSRGIICQRNGYGYVLTIDRNAIEGGVPETGVMASIGDEVVIYFKIMPVTTAAAPIPDDFTLIPAGNVVGETKFIPTGTDPHNTITYADYDDYKGAFRQGRNLSISQFYMCKHEVTQEEYTPIMGFNPSEFTTGAATGEIQEKRPVENVCWYDAIYYCNKRSLEEHLTPCYKVDGNADPSQWSYTPHNGDEISGTITCDFNVNGYRLPTEVEWEYAARGGQAGCDAASPLLYAGTSSYSEVGTYAWYCPTWGGELGVDWITHQVGLKQANSLGLFDMTGNVTEWCWDYYNEAEPSITAETPITGCETGTKRVIRGGSASDNTNLIISYRGGESGYHANVGFRLVRTKE